MFSTCPKCKKWENQKYLGVSCSQPKYLKIFKCENCAIHYTKEKKARDKNTKPQLLTKRETDSILKMRTACIKCQKFNKDKTIKRPPIDSESTDYEYIYVVFMGSHTQKNGKVMNKFYCRNHKKHPKRQRYQFSRKDKEEKIVSLRAFIEESTSKYFYKELRKLYKDTDIKHVHKLPKYKKEFRVLYGIGLPQTILAEIFHTSQPTIHRYIKENGFTREHELYIEETRKAVFLTKARVNNDEIETNKIFWKDINTSKSQ